MLTIDQQRAALKKLSQNELIDLLIGEDTAPAPRPTWNAVAKEAKDLLRPRAKTNEGERASAPASAAAPKTARAPRKPSATKKPKRSPDELAGLKATLTSFLRKNPGVGVESIAKDTGYTTKELTLPLKALVKSKQVKHTGTKRATKYTLTANGMSAAAAAPAN